MLLCGIACSERRNRFRRTVRWATERNHRPAARPEHGSGLRPEKGHSPQAAQELPRVRMQQNCECWWAPGLLPARAGTPPRFVVLLVSLRGFVRSEEHTSEL